MKTVTNTYVGPFTYWHNNPPAPFNPEYDKRAADWLTLAIFDAQNAGVYELPMSDRPAKIRAFYDARKANGTPNQRDVALAKKQLADC